MSCADLVKRTKRTLGTFMQMLAWEHANSSAISKMLINVAINSYEVEYTCKKQQTQIHFSSSNSGK